MQYGMFHQIRVDGGKEFYLTLAMQEMFAGLRSREDIFPHKQTQSKKVSREKDICYHFIIFYICFWSLPFFNSL